MDVGSMNDYALDKSKCVGYDVLFPLSFFRCQCAPCLTSIAGGFDVSALNQS